KALALPAAGERGQKMAGSRVKGKPVVREMVVAPAGPAASEERSANGAPARARGDERVKATRREQIAANQSAIANLRARLARQPDARALAEGERWDRFLAVLDVDHTSDRRLFR